MSFPIPTTEAGLDAFVSKLTTDFGLPPGDDTYDMVATMILHLANERAPNVTDEYFANGVLKSMANKVAYDKLQEFKAKREAKEAAELAKKQEDTQAQVSDGEPIQNPGV